jgi:Mg-chelatase subunit ChlI
LLSTFDAFIVQVRAVAELLPMLDVVEGDPFNSSPTDPKLMGPDALQRYRNGEKLPATKMRTPLVRQEQGEASSAARAAAALAEAAGGHLEKQQQ